MVTYEQVLELRWLDEIKSDSDTIQQRGREMTQPERDAMRALYGELKEAGYIDGLLFADNMVWSAHLTANGRKQASWVRFAWTKVIYVAKHLTSFLGGGVGGALILTLAYLATHPNVADSIVHAM